MFRRLRLSQLLRGRALSSATSSRRWEIDPLHASTSNNDARHIRRSNVTSSEDPLDRLRILYAAADDDSDSLRSGVDRLVSRAVRRQGSLLRSASTSDVPSDSNNRGTVSSVWERYGFASPSNTNEGDSPPPYSTFPSRSGPEESMTIPELADTSPRRNRDTSPSAELDARDTARERAIYMHSSPPPSYPRQTSRTNSAIAPSAPPSNSRLDSLSTVFDDGTSEQALSNETLSEASISDTSRSSNLIPSYLRWPNQPYLQTTFSHSAPRTFNLPSRHSSPKPEMQSHRQASETSSTWNDTFSGLNKNRSPSSIKAVSFAKPLSQTYPYPQTRERTSLIDDIDSDSNLYSSPVSALSSTSTNSSNTDVDPSKLYCSSDSNKTSDSDMVHRSTRSTSMDISISITATSLPSAVNTFTSILSEVDRIARAYRRFKEASKPTVDDEEEGAEANQLAEFDFDDEINLEDEDDFNTDDDDLEPLSESLFSLADILRSFSTSGKSASSNRNSGIDPDGSS